MYVYIYIYIYICIYAYREGTPAVSTRADRGGSTFGRGDDTVGKFSVLILVGNAPYIFHTAVACEGCLPADRWKPSSSSNFSIRAF